MFKGSQSVQKPTALGIMLQASSYGMTIPVVYGRAKSALLLTWLNNLRQGDSGKKGKKAGKKGAPPSYVANADLLIAQNPILGVLQMWRNNEPRYPLNFTSIVKSYSFGNSDRYTVGVDDAHPDPQFYAVIAVTISLPYDETFNDYGGPGSQRFTGRYEVPLVNAYTLGPDPSNPASARYFPFTYRWNPSLGPHVFIEGADSGLAGFGIDGEGLNLNIYYAQTIRGGTMGGLSPAAYLRLTFEDQLGDGPEYADGYEDQQIIYPMFAGEGSPNLDLGSSAMGPKMNAEVQGKFGVYPSGDCDFTDIIEDIVKSGLLQSGYGSSQSLNNSQQGAGCFDYPAVVQSRYAAAFEDVAGLGIKSLVLGSPIQKGDVIVVYDIGRDGGPDDPLPPTDSHSNTYTQISKGTTTGGSGDVAWPYGIWFSIASEDQSAGLELFSNNGNYGHTFAVFVLRGDSLAFDVEATTALHTTVGGPVSASPVTLTNDSNSDAIILAWYAQGNFIAPDENATDWKSLLPASSIGSAVPNILARRVTQPGTYSVDGLRTSNGVDAVVVLFAFKSTQPRSIARSFGNIIDEESLQLTKAHCRAYGLYGSLAMSAQKQASDWLKMFGDAQDESQGPGTTGAANCAFVWSGSKLKIIPFAEASAVGNGATYISPTAGGPVIDLDVDKGDFIFKDGEPPIQITILPKSEDENGNPLPNVLQYQIYPRGSDYNQVTISKPLAGSVANQGRIKEDPQDLPCVMDSTVGLKLLTIKGRRSILDKVRYNFTLDVRASLFEAMDLAFTITWRAAGIFQQPVRLLSMEEDIDSLTYKCVASKFIYGMCTPGDVTATEPVGSGGNRDADPGSVNAPIIFQPVPQLLENQAQPELWIVVSAQSPSYGGCLVYLSTNGGVSYGDGPIGRIVDSAVTGYLTEDWPSASDPDANNELSLDLAESRGELTSYEEADENNFVYPFYVDGAGTFLGIENESSPIAILGSMSMEGTDTAADIGELQQDTIAIAEASSPGSSPPVIVYELGAYSTAVMTGEFQWDIPTGAQGSPPGPSPYIRRAVFDAPSPGNGVDHPVGSRFAMLNPLGTGILKLSLDSRWIGVPLKLKFCAYNQFGGGLQDPSEVVVYTYTPIPQGLSGGDPWSGF